MTRTITLAPAPHSQVVTRPHQDALREIPDAGMLPPESDDDDDLPGAATDPLAVEPLTTEEIHLVERERLSVHVRPRSKR